MKKVLTIAGSDCSGGAGIQADLKTMTALGVYGMSVITSLTAQNTTGVRAIFDATPKFVAAQLDCVFSDIRPDAMKIGMVSNADIIETIAAKLKEHKAENIVVDPVMVATSGSKLLASDAEKKLIEKLFPLATLITPNMQEAAVLCGFDVENKEDMFSAAEKISKECNCNMLLKGGHLEKSADDLLYLACGKSLWFESARLENPNTHGTGCTLSSAIACGLSLGKTIEQSVADAKKYLTGAIAAGLNLGHGRGPLNHCWKQTKTDY